MSAEEEETNVEISIEDQLAPENAKPTKLNKNGKPRKVLSPEALEKLKLAREKANAIRKESYTKKLEDKVQKLKSVKKEEVENEEEVKEEKVSKPKGKKKTKIIVEQSSDDSDQFEPNDNVVFVKRITRKKKEISAPEPVKEPELEQELPPPEEPPQRPPTRQLTPQELALKNQYSAMFSGGFMNKRNYY
tara:strand:- start:280 stop:849 length:570 start_codon:yes stop_codon:yes gene_type:complete